MLFDPVIDKIDRTSLFSLLEKADADPHLFYRATVEKEDTLSHCSMDTLQNCYASKVSDLTPDAFVGSVINKAYIEGTGEKEVVFRKRLFVERLYLIVDT